jgi:hypothetical protein
MCEHAVTTCKLLEALGARSAFMCAKLGVEPRLPMLLINNSRAEWETGARDGWINGFVRMNIHEGDAGEITSEYR